MGVVKEIKTTVKLRYDTFNNWTSANPQPLAGEVCIAVIPTSAVQQPDYTVGQYPTATGLTPYAIGIKVGDGVNYFNNLPWIQAIAGDVYAWAKQSAPPTATNLTAVYNETNTNIQAVLNTLSNELANLDGEDIQVSYNNTDTTIQAAIDSITESIGGIVAANISPESLSSALNRLQDQLAGQTNTIFSADQSGVTYKIDTLTQNGLTITATSSPLTVSNISDLIFNRQYNQSSNKAATMGDLTALRSDILNSIPSAMRFRGISTTTLTDGGVENPTINDIEITSTSEGDIVLYNNKEFLWTGTAWELLGDEGSYAIKGSITKNDLVGTLQTEIDNKLESADLAAIAFDGEVKNLHQTDTTILVFDCGNATDKLFDS